MVTVGLVGVGYWGSNYVRIFQQLPGCDLAWCADLDEDRLRDIQRKHRTVRTTTDYRDIIEDESIEAACIATPPETHYDVAREFLENGIDVLIEKPLTLDSGKAWKLHDIAQECDQIVLTGHIFEYHPAVRELHSVIQCGSLGNIYYLQSTRTGLGPIRQGIGALWDLAPHDISTFRYLLDDRIAAVRCLSQSFVHDRNDSAFLFLEFDGGATGFVHCSWLHPSKERTVTVVGDQKMAVFDDTSADQLEIHDDGVETGSSVDGLSEFHHTIRRGDVTIPRIQRKEPLKEQGRHFLECIESRETPLTDAADGAQVVEVLEGAVRSARQGGDLIEL